MQVNGRTYESPRNLGTSDCLQTTFLGVSFPEPSGNETPPNVVVVVATESVGWAVHFLQR